MTSRNVLRAALVAAAVCAFVVLLNLFSEAIRVVCLAVIAAATVLTAPARNLGDTPWWWLLVGGAAASILGAIVAQSSSSLGGWLALVGGLVVMVAATIGFPAAGDGE